jgi:hypothetical protein
MHDDTRVLTSDLRWIAASELVRGDELLAFDEDQRDANASGGKRRGRLHRTAVVQTVRLAELPCFDVIFSDGSCIRCPAERQWLTHTNGKGTLWIQTDALRAGRCSSNLIKPLRPWDAQLSREAGYLAAALDGEGCLVQRDLRPTSTGGVAATNLTFVQKDNAMFAEVERCLRELGFAFGERRGRDTGVFSITLSRRPEVLRFLGSIRPLRLLDKFRPEMLGMISHRAVKLVSKTYVGRQPIAIVHTDSRTFFAEGLAAHD